MRKSDLGQEIVQAIFSKDPSNQNKLFADKQARKVELEENLRQVIQRHRELLYNWRRTFLIDSLIEDYKKKLNQIYSFMSYNENQLYLFFKSELKVKSDYHEDTVDSKIRELVKNVREEMDSALKTYNFSENFKKYQALYQELKAINLENDDELVHFVKVRSEYAETYSKLEKFKEWHNGICGMYGKFVDSIGKLGFNIPNPEKTTQKCREIYDGFDKYAQGQDAIAANRYSIPILYDDLARLRPGVWLNDRIINFFNEYLIEKIEKLKDENPLQRVILYKSFLFSSLTNGGVISLSNYSYGLVRKFTEKYQGDKCIFIHFARIGYIVNVNNNHWVFAVIDNQKHKIILYDSLRSQQVQESVSDNAILKIFQKYIKDEVMDKQGLDERSAESFQANYKMELGASPRQLNGADCGVFLCKNMYLFSKFEEITAGSYDQEAIYEFRFKIFELILKIGINTEGFLKFEELL